MIGARRLIATQPAAGGATIAFLQAVEDPANLTTYTFSSQNIGTADSDRTILVCVMARGLGASAFSVSSVTVGGNSGSAVVQASNTSTNACLAAIFAVDVSTGTSADVVVTLSRSALRASISLYRCTGIDAALDTTTATTEPLSLDVTPTNFAVGCAMAGKSTVGEWSWSGLTEDYDAPTSESASAQYTSAHDETSGSTTVTATAGFTDVEPVGVSAAW